MRSKLKNVLLLNWISLTKTHLKKSIESHFWKFILNYNFIAHDENTNKNEHEFVIDSHCFFSCFKSSNLYYYKGSIRFLKNIQYTFKTLVRPSKFSFQFFTMLVTLIWFSAVLFFNLSQKTFVFIFQTKTMATL